MLALAGLRMTNRTIALTTEKHDTAAIDYTTSVTTAVDLPSYTSYEKLRTQLLLAINEGGEGFGYVTSISILQSQLLIYVR